MQVITIITVFITTAQLHTVKPELKFNLLHLVFVVTRTHTAALLSRALIVWDIGMKKNERKIMKLNS